MRVTEIDGAAAVVIDNRAIVDFVNGHSDDVQLLSAFEGMLESVCVSVKQHVDRHMSSAACSQEMTRVIECMERLDDRQARIASTVASAAEAAFDKMGGRLMGLVAAVDSTVTSAVAKLDVDAVVARLSSALEAMLADGTRHGSDALALILRSELVAPFGESFRRLNEAVAGMPGLLSDASRQEATQLQAVTADGVARLVERVKELDDRVARSLTHVVDKWNESRDFSNLQQSRLSDQVKLLPDLAKGTLREVMRDLEEQGHKVALAVDQAQQQLRDLHGDVRDSMSSVALIKSGTDDVRARVDQWNERALKDSCSNQVKGSSGETLLFDLLSEKLLGRDGYVVEQVHGQARSCDMVVKREKHPPVRIESKAHGRGTGEKVRHREVEKFKSDLLDLDNHGIFVSLYSGIVGKGALEIEQLSNGKMAVYIAYQNFEPDIVLDMLHLLYRLDAAMHKDEDGSARGLTVSREALARIKAYVQDFSAKIRSIKTHMRESVCLLNELTLDLIENTLMGGGRGDDEAGSTAGGGRGKAKGGRGGRGGGRGVPDASPPLVCPYCAKESKNNAGLGMHMKTCKMAPVVTAAEDAEDAAPDA